MKSFFLAAFSILTTALLLGACQADAGSHEHHNHVNQMSTDMTATTFFVLLSAGFFTGLSHCVGMCGSLVGAFSMQQKTIKSSITAPLLMYQAGRITTYVIIGMITASIGAGLQFAAIGQGLQVGLSIFIGLLMLFIGLALMGKFISLRWIESAALAKWASALIGRLMTSRHALAPVGLGMANGLLPCGPVYAMALLAATAANPLQGGLVMLVFGLGTLPAMMGMGLVSARLSVTFRKRLYRFAAILIMAIGLQQIMRGLALGGVVGHFHIGQVMIW